MGPLEVPVLDVSASELLWTLVGRVPVAVLLVALTLRERARVGTKAALLGLSGFCAGAVVGTAALPSILGALGGGVLGAVLSWRAVRVPWPTPAVPTAALVALMALGRWGCVLSGCCFGVVTTSSWGLRYGPRSLAHGLHHALGLVTTDGRALPVVPVQALESLGVLVLLALAWALRRKVRSDGAWSLGLVSGVLLLRAGLDPLRAMVNTASSVRLVGPLSAFQWGAVALALGALGWARVLARRAPSVPTSSPPPASTRSFALVWLGQVLGASAFQSEGTWLLRVLAVSSLAVCGGALVLALPRPSRVRWALAAAVLVLIPRVPLADPDSGSAPHARAWIYAVHPSGKLVRLAPGGTSPDELSRRFLALADPPPDEPRPTPPPLESAPPPAEAAPAQETPPTPRAHRRTLSGTLLGGQELYDVTTCNGSGGNAIQQFGELHAAYEDEGERTAFQLRGRLLLNHTSVRPSDPTGRLGGGFVAGGLYEWKWRVVSLGVGGSLGVASPAALYPISLLPLALGSDSLYGAHLVLWPILYLRLEAIQGWAFEVGTGSRYQLEDGIFAGFRFGSDAPDAIAVRAGAEMNWAPEADSTARFFLGVGFSLVPSYRLELRAMGRPPEKSGVPFSGAVRLVREF